MVSPRRVSRPFLKRTLAYKTVSAIASAAHVGSSSRWNPDPVAEGRAYKGQDVGCRGHPSGAVIRLKRVPDVKRATLHSFIDETVRDEAEAIYTDELAAYLGADHDTRETVDEWVFGDVHTNTIEGSGV